jgi:glycerol-3-phosphate O-acyltransferase
VLERSAGQDDGAFQLKVIGRSLIQAFERYYITVAALTKNGPHALTSSELESACTLTAQRLGLLQELSAPEFFDKSLFRGFIQKLRERRLVWTDDAGKLDYDIALEGIVRDARVILSREVRHSILKITPGGSEKDAASGATLDDEEEATAPISPALLGDADGTSADAPIVAPILTDASAGDLHERHVAAEHHKHEHHRAEALPISEDSVRQRD